MKVKVIQVRIGEANWNGDITPKYHNFETSFCIPSVRSWAKRRGYDYEMIEESSINDDKNFFRQDSHRFTSERLVRMYSEEHDYVIYVDADIAISNKAEDFPLEPGLCICPQVEGDKALTEGFQSGSYPDSFVYFNAGIYSVDRITGKNIQDYFLRRFASGDNSNMHYVDQDILNAWAMMNMNLCHKLGNEWNYQIGHMNNHMIEFHLNSHPDMVNANAIHFLGITKKYFRQVFNELKEHPSWNKQVDKII